MWQLLVEIAIINCDWQNITTNKKHPQPAVLFACSKFAINKSRWLRHTVKLVSVVQIVSADACMQSVQESNPTDDWKILKRFTAICFLELL